MDRARTKAPKGCDMLRGRVTFVLGKPVAGVDGIHGSHVLVSVALGEYRGGGDRRAFGVALWYCRMCPTKAANGEAVDNRCRRLDRETSQGAAHGRMTRD